MRLGGDPNRIDFGQRQVPLGKIDNRLRQHWNLQGEALTSLPRRSDGPQHWRLCFVDYLVNCPANYLANYLLGQLVLSQSVDLGSALSEAPMYSENPLQ